jgi:uncharacterized protein (DUF2147 family)
MAPTIKKLAMLCLVLPLAFLPAFAQARSNGATPAQKAAPYAPPSSATPEGLWITANRDAVIQIAPCGSGLCGYIVGMFLNPTDPTPKDWAGTSQWRLNIIEAAPRRDDSGRNYWTGSITDPRNGDAYNAVIRVDAQNDLLLRGYIGLPLFGKTQTWTPYHGNLAENCRLPQSEG